MQRLIEDSDGEVAIELSSAKIRFTIGDVVLTSKLIDGTFPDYARVIPTGNDKELVVDKKDFEAAVDRVSTVSSERGRAVKLSLSGGKLRPVGHQSRIPAAPPRRSRSTTIPTRSISASTPATCSTSPAQIDGEVAVLKLADPGSPTLIQDKDAKGALYVLMPMRV